MKQYIQTSILLLLLCASIVACNDSDMGTNTTYPEQNELGNWHSEYASGDYDYIVSLSLDMNGDTICSMQEINETTGVASNYVGGYTSYDPRTGLTTAFFEQTPELGTTALLYIAYRTNKTDRGVQFFKINSMVGTSLENSFVANPVKGFEINNCQFNEQGKDLSDGFVVLFGSSRDSNAFTYVNREDMSETGSYTWDYTQATGQATAVSTVGVSHTYSLSINDKNQLVIAEEGGNTYIMERVQ